MNFAFVSYSNIGDRFNDSTDSRWTNQALDVNFGNILDVSNNHNPLPRLPVNSKCFSQFPSESDPADHGMIRQIMTGNGYWRSR